MSCPLGMAMPIQQLSGKHQGNMTMTTNSTTTANADNLFVWEVLNGAGEVVKQSLDRAGATICARVFRRHLGGKFSARVRAFYGRRSGDREHCVPPQQLA
jgi:hypothetical protein